MSINKFFRVALAAAAFSISAAAVHAQVVDDAAARKAAHQPVINPTPKKGLYPAIDKATAELNAAIVKARREHKRVLVDFGGDWCGDCQVLDVYFNQAPNNALLAKNFVKVNVNIGQMDSNLDIAKRCGLPVPLKGVPALAVLDGTGKVLYAQTSEFSDMRYMQSQSVTEFLTKWKR